MGSMIKYINSIKVPFVDLKLQYLEHKEEILGKIDEVLSSGQYILGEYVQEFEKAFAKACERKYAVGVGSGTEALTLSLKAYGIGSGDEVITVANSFLASVSCIALVGAKPILVDVGEDYNIDPIKFKAAITNKTRAVIPVHLTGRPANMKAIHDIAKVYNLIVIEDAAQAFGGYLNEKPIGSFGNVGCFSFHPLKVLHCYGDGGMIVTDEEDTYRYLLKARNHGLVSRDESEFWSVNSRLDAMQAAILLEQLPHVESLVRRRRQIAELYKAGLKGLSEISIPVEEKEQYGNYANFVIKSAQRDKLQAFLLSKGIETKIHYEKPIHLINAAENCGYQRGDFPVAERLSDQILSLPIFAELMDEQIDYVIQSINEFYE